MVLFCLAKWGEASEDRLATLGYLKQALEVCAPREPAYLLTMDARTALDLGDRSRALEDLERAERAEPGYWEVLFLRGRLAAEDQSPHKAEQAFRRASEACPDFDLFLGWVVGLPEEAGVLAVQAAGKIERIPLVRREASLRRRADAVGAKIVYLALDAACRGEPSEAVIRLFEFARRDPDANQAALAWEEALFWVGRDGFEQAPAAIARARELGFDPDRLRLLEGKLASRKSLQAEQYAALEEVATYGRKDGVARSIAFSELAGYAENWEAAQRHVERAREQAPDDPLVWEAYLQATGSEDPKAIEARLAEALPRFGASWLQFLELEAQVDFFAAIQDRDDREGWALATQRLKQRVEGIARISGGVRGLLTGVDMVLLRPSRDRRELAVAWLEEAARRALPHQRHEILLTQGYVELTRPKEELDPERVLDLWRQARAVEPKSKLKGNWHQIFDQRIGAERLAEFGEEFLPDPEDRELKPPK